MALKSFSKAVKSQQKLKLAIDGPAGSGKTYTALAIASNLMLNPRIAVISTERQSASLYADDFAFDVCELDSFHPQEYIDAIHAAEADGYDVIVIDSLSHAWSGKDGVLQEVDKIAASKGSKFNAWGPAGKLQDALFDAILKSKCHIIVTIRSKMEFVQETDARGKTVVKKLGMKPVQRDDAEYEFTLYASMDQDNNFIVKKTRCSSLNGVVVNKPGKDVADMLTAWLNSGAPVVEVPKVDLLSSVKELLSRVQTEEGVVAARKEIASLVKDATQAERDSVTAMYQQKLTEVRAT